MVEINRVLLATQKALLGVITPNLRAVIVDYVAEQNTVYIRLYYHGQASEELVDLWDSAITEIIAAFGADYQFDEAIERIDFPQKIPFRGVFQSGYYAYLRKRKKHA